MNFKLLLLDIDGVFTDNCIYYTVDGKAMKKFNYEDFAVLSKLRKNNPKLKIVIFTSDDSGGTDISRKRFLDLRFEVERVSNDEREKFIKNKIAEFESNEVIFLSDNFEDAHLASELKLFYFVYPKGSGASSYFGFNSLKRTYRKGVAWRGGGEGFVADTLYYHFPKYVRTFYRKENK